MKFLTTFLYFLLPFFLFAQAETYRISVQLMGCDFEILAVAENESKGKEYLESAVHEIRRIESLISSWNYDSQTSLLNRSAGLNSVRVDPELFQLIERAISLSSLTDGAFDISYASMDHLWKFDGSMSTLPDSEAIASSIAKVGYQKIVLDKFTSTVFLPETGMKIGFGAIGKGYAADRARALLETLGCRAGIINASGDLTAWGHQPDGREWTVGITNPLDKSKAFGWLPVANQAVVTSGSYEKFVRLNGIRYAHILDPRTGYPATGIVSASVFAPKAELADALATALFVMGSSTGLDFINQLPGIEAVIIDEQNKVHTSSGLQLQTIRQ
jgi:thiamine biosynthesis lipoprotein